MIATDKYVKGAGESTLAAALAVGASSLTVVDGGSFPSSDFEVLIRNGGRAEIIHVASRSGSTLSGLTRAYKFGDPDRPSGFSFPAGLSVFEVITGDDIIGGTGGSGGSSADILKTVTQTAHGFTAGQVVRWNGTTYVLSEADVAADSDVDGFVAASVDANTFSLQSDGYGDFFTGLVAGSDYFESATVQGGITATEPSTAGQVSKPLLHAVTTTGGWIQNMRGLVIPAAATITKEFVLLADGTALATGEDFASYVYEIGADLDGWSLTGAVWTVKTVSSSGVPSLGLRKNSTEMLSTNLTIDVSETSSRTGTAEVIKSDGSQTVAAGDKLHFDCDVAGTGTKGSEVRTTWTSP